MTTIPIPKDSRLLVSEVPNSSDYAEIDPELPDVQTDLRKVINQLQGKKNRNLISDSYSEAGTDSEFGGDYQIQSEEGNNEYENGTRVEISEFGKQLILFLMEYIKNYIETNKSIFFIGLIVILVLTVLIILNFIINLCILMSMIKR